MKGPLPAELARNQVSDWSVVVGVRIGVGAVLGRHVGIDDAGIGRGQDAEELGVRRRQA